MTDFVKNNGVAQAFDCSAKDKTGVEDAFVHITKMALANVEEAEPYIASSVFLPEKLVGSGTNKGRGCC